MIRLRKYLPLFLYPLFPGLLGVAVVRWPKLVFACLVISTSMWIWRKVKGKPLIPIGLSLPTTGFPPAVGMMVFCAVVFQSVASFCAGVVAVAGGSLAGMLPYAMGPSVLVCLAVVLTRRLSH